MAKPEYSHDDLVRVQKVGGASMELHGKFAGDVLGGIKEMSLIDLGKAGNGHFVLKVSGGMTYPENQEEMDLKVDPEKESVKPDQLVADIAPEQKTMDRFSEMLCGMVIMKAGYDQGSGLYTLDVSIGKVKDDQPVGGWQIRFVSCTITERLEKKKAVPLGRSTIVFTGTDKSVHACLYDSLMQGSRQHDRWSYLADNGCDDKHLLTHIREVYGKTAKSKDIILRGMSCKICGGRNPYFVYDADGKRDGWIPGDAHEVSNKPLLEMVREVLGIGEEKGEDTK